MSGSRRRELHRFRPGESCDECNARRWYSDSGFRYCERGHLIESFIPYDHEDEENYGGGGHVARKQKEVIRRESRILTGVPGRELYLECLQLLLRLQIAWLQEEYRQRRPPPRPSPSSSQQFPPSQSSRPRLPDLFSDDLSEYGGAGHEPSAAPSTMVALESVVRDLWDLRVRGFHGMTVLPSEGSRSRSRSRSMSRSRSRSRLTSEGLGGGGPSPLSQGLDSDANTTDAGGGSQRGGRNDDNDDDRMMYSSQPVSEDDVSASQSRGGRGYRRRPGRSRSRSALSWASDADQHWNLPGVMETLALCYLGCVLLRLPYRVGDFARWARNNQIPFLGALHFMPKPMRDRLPPFYQAPLMTRTASFSGGELHQAILSLVRGFHNNFQLRLPGLNVPPILWRYTRELGLPVEVYAGVQEMVRLSHEDFGFPLERPRLYWLDHPDIFLLAHVVFVTKLLLPFNAKEDNYKATNGRHGSASDPRSAAAAAAPSSTLCMDWDKWAVVFSEPSVPGDDIRSSSRPLQRHEVDKLRGKDVWKMTVAQIDDYMDWHQTLRLNEIQEDGHVLRLFPLEPVEPRPPVSDVPESVIDARFRRVQETCLLRRNPTPEQNPSPLWRQDAKHEHYRKESELSSPARQFYSKAAEAGGITMDVLISAVAMLEKRWMAWVQSNEAPKENGGPDEEMGP